MALSENHAKYASEKLTESLRYCRLSLRNESQIDIKRKVEQRFFFPMFNLRRRDMRYDVGETLFSRPSYYGR